MSKKREALQDAKMYLLGHSRSLLYPNEALNRILADIEAALAEPEQEPVLAGRGSEMFKKLVGAAEKMARVVNESSRWGCVGPDAYDIALDEFQHLASHVCTGIYSPPQPREWQELSEDEAMEAFERSGTVVDTSPIEIYVICKFILAELRAKNGG